MSFTHIVTFKWGSDAVDAASVTEALVGFVRSVDGVQSYRCGADIGLTPSAYDFAVIGTFDTRDAFLAYRDHPEHQRILKDMIVPHLEARTVVQLED